VCAEPVPFARDAGWSIIGPFTAAYVMNSCVPCTPYLCIILLTSAHITHFSHLTTQTGLQPTTARRLVSLSPNAVAAAAAAAAAVSQAPEGSPPDVCMNIPHSLRDLADILARDFADDPQALHCLVRTTSVVTDWLRGYHMGHAAREQELQQEQQEQRLQDAVAGLQEQARVQAERYEEKLRKQKRRFSAQLGQLSAQLEASQQLVGELQQQVAELRDEQQQQQRQQQQHEVGELQQQVATLKAALEGVLGRQL